MNRHVPEERLALYVTGDLGENSESIQEHLNVCADCRALAAELQQTCSLLGSVPDETTTSETLAEVRRAVIDRLQRGHRSARAWKWALGAAAVAAMIALASFAGYQSVPGPVAPPPPKVAAIAPEAPLPLPEQPAPVHHRIHRRRAPGIQSVALIKQPHGAPIIKIATTDPHVVILLASDERTKPE